MPFLKTGLGAVFKTCLKTDLKRFAHFQIEFEQPPQWGLGPGPWPGPPGLFPDWAQIVNIYTEPFTYKWNLIT